LFVLGAVSTLGWEVRVGEGFIADVAALRAAGQRAGELADGLRADDADATGVSSGDVGHEALARQVTAFSDQWRTSLARFTAAAAATGQNLTDVAGRYEAAEQANADLFTGIADQLGGRYA
jgi:hypothetical protein